MERQQTTIKRPINLHGIGLHTGRQVHLEIIPAEAGTGILFQRTDLPGATPIRASALHITSTELSTVIGSGKNTVSTVEHLMAAFAGLEIDNALVRVDAPEVPIMDGSAAPFVEMILAVGTAKVSGFRKLIVVNQSFEVRDGDRYVRVDPCDGRDFSCAIEFRSAAIGKQAIDFSLSKANFLELCDARTFCHVREVDAMRAAGLALGGSLANAIVVNDSSVLNDEGLRSADEFVRHKLLDCIGDLALLGAPLIGKVSLAKAGHAMHAKFMRELLASGVGIFTVVNCADEASSRKAAMVEGLAHVAAPLYG